MFNTSLTIYQNKELELKEMEIRARVLESASRLAANIGRGTKEGLIMDTISISKSLYRFVQDPNSEVTFY